MYLVYFKFKFDNYQNAGLHVNSWVWKVKVRFLNVLQLPFIGKMWGRKPDMTVIQSNVMLKVILAKFEEFIRILINLYYLDKYPKFKKQLNCYKT